MRRLALAVAAAVAAGCETALQPCPGTAQGTLSFATCLPDPARPDDCPVTPADPACPFASGKPLAAFSATIAWTEGSGANLCVQRPLARPKAGSHVGDDVTFSSVEAATSLPGCPCPVDVAETLSGTLERANDGSVTGFLAGSLVNVFTRSGSTAAAACYAADPVAETSACPPAGDGCRVVYGLTGSR